VTDLKDRKNRLASDSSAAKPTLNVPEAPLLPAVPTFKKFMNDGVCGSMCTSRSLCTLTLYCLPSISVPHSLSPRPPPFFSTKDEDEIAATPGGGKILKTKRRKIKWGDEAEGGQIKQVKEFNLHDNVFGKPPEGAIVISEEVQKEEEQTAGSPRTMSFKDALKQEKMRERTQNKTMREHENEKRHTISAAMLEKGREAAEQWQKPGLIHVPPIKDDDGNDEEPFVPGVDSKEVAAQTERISSVMAAIYIKAEQIPPSPAEPEPGTAGDAAETIEIPLSEASPVGETEQAVPAAPENPMLAMLPPAVRTLPAAQVDLLLEHPEEMVELMKSGNTSAEAISAFIANLQARKQGGMGSAPPVGGGMGGGGQMGGGGMGGGGMGGGGMGGGGMGGGGMGMGGGQMGGQMGGMGMGGGQMGGQMGGGQMGGGMGGGQMGGGMGGGQMGGGMGMGGGQMGGGMGMGGGQMGGQMNGGGGFPPAPPGQPTTLWVSNFPPAMSKVDLYHFFKGFGPLEERDIYLPTPSVGANLYSFINYRSVDGPRNAANAQPPLQIGGQMLKMNIQTPNTKAQQRMGGPSNGNQGQQQQQQQPHW
jgi:hypothetical protein